MVKNITEALAEQRPTDIVVQVINNKFAVTRPALVGGGHGEQDILELNNGKVFLMGRLNYIYEQMEYVETLLPNVQTQVVFYSFPENGKYNVGLVKHWDNRKYKQQYRRLKRALINSHLKN